MDGTLRCRTARTRSTRRATLLVGHSWHLPVPHRPSRRWARCSRRWATTVHWTKGWARRARATTRRRSRRTPSSSRWGSGPRRRSRTSDCRRSRPIPQVAKADEGLALYKHVCLRGVVFAPEGRLKLVFEKGSGRILGVHIAGASAQFNFRVARLADLRTGRRALRADPLRHGAGARGAHDPVRAGSDVLGRDLPRKRARWRRAREWIEGGPSAATRRARLGFGQTDDPQTGDVQLKRPIVSIRCLPARPSPAWTSLRLYHRDAIVDVVDLLRHVDEIERDVNRDQVGRAARPARRADHCWISAGSPRIIGCGKTL